MALMTNLQTAREERPPVLRSGAPRTGSLPCGPQARNARRPPP